MKNLTILINAFIILNLTVGCEKTDNVLNTYITDGFCLKINDSISYNSNAIDFYDFSSHLIYLKATNSFSYSNRGTFSVQVDEEEIYIGQMYPMYSSSLPIGPFIQCAPTFYKDYIIPIGFTQMKYVDGKLNEDTRGDERIVKALEKYNQSKKGLSSEIVSVQKISDTKVKITIALKNLDSDKLLILDPDKMGIELFHYFTNGLIINDDQNNSYTHK
jgi:hypothetical protein